MSEKMLVTQALDERDLLVKKITDKIAKASFVDTIKPNEDKVYAKRIDKTEYAKEAEAAYQQINDLIDRFQKIDAAIVDSNAKTEIKTSYGTFTVAGAISLRSRLRGMDSYDGDADFEGKLMDKMNNEYNECVRFCDMKNSQIQSTAENMRLSDYSGPPTHPGRSLAQLDRASAHLIQSAFRHMPIADQPIY